MKTLTILLALLAMNTFAQQNLAKVISIEPVSKVWSGHPVGFDFKIHKDTIFIAFYDDNRQMTIVSKPLDKQEWSVKKLPTSVGWDSHNYITFTFDDQDHIHLSGNMHCCKLIYFRSEKPMDIESLTQVTAMTGELENRCTYPQFMRGPSNELIFHYRDGGSGNGSEIYNVYDLETKTWSRLLDKPLSDGQGDMNAYFCGPVLGPDGWFHLAWVWRDTPSCDTNHNLSYMRSKDLRNWETVTGTKVDLPITLKTEGLIVQPSERSKSGLINMGITIGFDNNSQPVITYHMYDEKGFSQIYNARWENNKWNRVPSTNWDRRWDFTGGGSVPCVARGSKITTTEDKALQQTVTFSGWKSETWKLDQNTLKPIEKIKPPQKDKLPPEWSRIKGDHKDLRRMTRGCFHEESNTHYLLRWETLPSNRDRPRPEPHPNPSTLELWKVQGNI